MRLKRPSIVAAIICAVGCASPDPDQYPALLEEAELRCLDGQFIDAEPMLREYLRHDPQNAVAHYYLGRCYLSGDLINLEIARGEITAAFSLYHQVGQASPQGRFTEEYFQLMCLADISKTYLSEVALQVPRMEISERAKRLEAIERITRCKALYDRAREVNPEAELTVWLRLRIAEATVSVLPRKP